jgi:uncharacterized glyoxalase superfamily protein PhnB
MSSPSSATFRKLSPVLVVDAVEPCLAFWTERLGFAVTAQVPEGDRVGFAILARDGVEVMYQSRASAAADVPAMAEGAAGTALFIEVSDVAAVERAMAGVEIVVPRRQTFYGMDEIGVREPGGSVVMFAQPVQ